MQSTICEVSKLVLDEIGLKGGMIMIRIDFIPNEECFLKDFI